jgi:hypothetical protein
MNQIAQIILGHFKDGNVVVRVSPDKSLDAQKFTVYLSDGTSHEHDVETKSHEDFMDQWKQAAEVFAIKWDSLSSAKDK